MSEKEVFRNKDALLDINDKPKFSALVSLIDPASLYDVWSYRARPIVDRFESKYRTLLFRCRNDRILAMHKS